MPKSLLLAGAGHTHLLLLQKAGQLRKAGLEVTLIDPGLFHYSGTVGAVLQGRISADQGSVDPDPVCAANGVTRLQTRVTGLDDAKRQVYLENGETHPYDLLSVNTGSISSTPFPGAAEHCLPVKPLTHLHDLRKRLRKSGHGIRHITVIGGGPTGCELAACLATLHPKPDPQPVITLILSEDLPAPGLPGGARRHLARRLAKLGVALRPNLRVDKAEQTNLHLSDGSTLASDLHLNACGLKPASPFENGNPKTGEQGGFAVSATLESISHPDLFAVGDCAAFTPRPLPCLGVHGVRQAPVLLANLLAKHIGSPLKPYQPPRTSLSILHTGDQQALAVYGPLWLSGRLPRRLKDHIDQRFMHQFR